MDASSRNQGRMFSQVFCDVYPVGDGLCENMCKTAGGFSKVEGQEGGARKTLDQILNSIVGTRSCRGQR